MDLDEFDRIGTARLDELAMAFRAWPARMFYVMIIFRVWSPLNFRIDRSPSDDHDDESRRYDDCIPLDPCPFAMCNEASCPHALPMKTVRSAAYRVPICFHGF